MPQTYIESLIPEFAQKRNISELEARNELDKIWTQSKEIVDKKIEETNKRYWPEVVKTFKQISA